MWVLDSMFINANLESLYLFVNMAMWMTIN